VGMGAKSGTWSRAEACLVRTEGSTHAGRRHGLQGCLSQSAQRSGDGPGCRCRGARPSLQWPRASRLQANHGRIGHLPDPYPWLLFAMRRSSRQPLPCCADEGKRRCSCARAAALSAVPRTARTFSLQGGPCRHGDVVKEAEALRRAHKRSAGFAAAAAASGCTACQLHVGWAGIGQRQAPECDLRWRSAGKARASKRPTMARSHTA
jgi:hypothetical protein